MRKINLSSYPVEVHTERGIENKPYDVKGSIVASLYHPDLRLSAMDLLDNDRLAQKIKAANDSILLEEAEYKKIQHIFEVIRGFELNDVELVRRVFDAQEVDVQEV